MNWVQTGAGDRGGRDSWGRGRSGPSGRWSAGADDWGRSRSSGGEGGAGWDRSWGSGGGGSNAEPYWGGAPTNGSAKASHASGGSARGRGGDGCQIKVSNVPKN